MTTMAKMLKRPPVKKSSAKASATIAAPVKSPGAKTNRVSQAKSKIAEPGKAGAAVTATNKDYVLEDQIGFRLRRAHQRASVIFNDVMARFDVTPTQFAALAKLDDLGVVSQNQLGRATAMDPATILGVVGRLVRQGLIRTRPDPIDGRQMLLELTPEGKTQMQAMKVAAASVSKRTMTPLSPDEVKILLQLLAKIG